MMSQRIGGEINASPISPTLERIENNAVSAVSRSAEIRESLAQLLSDLGCYGEPSSGMPEQAEPSAIIARICHKQQDGLEILGNCEDLIAELRRQLFSTPMNKAPQQGRAA